MMEAGPYPKCTTWCRCASFGGQKRLTWWAKRLTWWAKRLTWWAKRLTWWAKSAFQKALILIAWNLRHLLVDHSRDIPKQLRPALPYIVPKISQLQNKHQPYAMMRPVLHSLSRFVDGHLKQSFIRAKNTQPNDLVLLPSISTINHFWSEYKPVSIRHINWNEFYT